MVVEVAQIAALGLFARDLAVEPGFDLAGQALAALADRFGGMCWRGMKSKLRSRTGPVHFRDPHHLLAALPAHEPGVDA